MKPNFVLTPSTLGVFMKRFKKLLGVTCMLESKSVYTGRKNISYPLRQAGIKGLRHQITETIKSYIDRFTVKYDSYPSGMRLGAGEGIIIRINSDSCAVIYWGQKIKWCPNKFVLIGEPKMDKWRDCGSTTTYKVCHEVAKGIETNYWEEKQAAEYWADVEAGFFD